MSNETPNSQTIYEAAIAAADNSPQVGLSQNQLELANLHRVERAANALGVKTATAERKGEQIALFNFQMLSGLFNAIPYSSVSARDAWLKFRELNERLTQDGGLPIMIEDERAFYEIPSIPDHYTQSERYKIRRATEDMKRFEKDALIVQNLPQLKNLDDNTRRYGGLTTVKAVARDIYEIYGQSLKSQSIVRRLIRRVVS